MDFLDFYGILCYYSGFLMDYLAAYKYSGLSSCSLPFLSQSRFFLLVGLWIFISLLIFWLPEFYWSFVDALLINFYHFMISNISSSYIQVFMHKLGGCVKFAKLTFINSQTLQNKKKKKIPPPFITVLSK